MKDIKFKDKIAQWDEDKENQYPLVAESCLKLSFPDIKQVVDALD